MLDDASKQRVKQLCDLIAKEQDTRRFTVLIAELNQLLENCAPAIKKTDGDGNSPYGETTFDRSREPS